MGLLTQQEAAKLARVSARSFRDWGIEPADFDGRRPLYRQEDVEAERERRRAMTAEGRQPSSARDQLEAERVRKLKIANDRDEGSLIPFADAKVFAAEVGALVSGQLAALPGRLANELAGINDPGLVRERIRFEVTRIRKTLSDRLALVGALGRGGRDPVPAADPEPGRVGKRKPRTTTRKRRARAVPD